MRKVRRICLALAAEIRKDESVGAQVIDVAEASSTAAEGTLYVQCLSKHKVSVIEYIEAFLEAYAKLDPHDTSASITYPRHGQFTGSSAQSAANTINTWHRFQTILDEDTIGSNFR